GVASEVLLGHIRIASPEAIGACAQVRHAAQSPVGNDARTVLTVGVVGAPRIRKSAVLGPCAETHRGTRRSDIAHGEIGGTNLDVEHLTQWVTVRLFESPHTRLDPPARRYQIRRIEKSLLCL